MHDVFISYPNENKAIADAICAILEEYKIRCWIAPRDILPCERYPEALMRAIDESRIMILVLSSETDRSPHIMRELERALNQNLIIIPFRIDDVEPTPSMQYYIGTLQWLDALTPPLEKHLNRLADTTIAFLSLN